MRKNTAISLAFILLMAIAPMLGAATPPPALARTYPPPAMQSQTARSSTNPDPASECGG